MIAPSEGAPWALNGPRWAAPEHALAAEDLVGGVGAEPLVGRDHVVRLLEDLTRAAGVLIVMVSRIYDDGNGRLQCGSSLRVEQ